MSEITVTIPLSVLTGAGVENLTPQGISAALGQIENYNESKKAVEQRMRVLANDVSLLAQGMRQTLDGDLNMLEKFRALRELASKAQQLGAMYQ